MRIVSAAHVNIGDTHSVCDDKTRAHFLDNGYVSLGWMNTTTLDDALLACLFDHVERVDVMKIDVEGFEPSVIFGGNRFFQSEYPQICFYGNGFLIHGFAFDLGVKGTITFARC